MSISGQIERLNGLRWDLADNLTEMGVPSTHEETLAELVPKVLLILQGNLDQPVFSALQSEFDVSFGYFGMNEEASFNGICTIKSFYLIDELRFRITGTGLSSLNITSTGWTRTDSDGEILLVATGLNRMQAKQQLNAIVIAFDNETAVDASIQVSALTTTGEVIEATGSTLLVFKPGTTWEMVEAANLTWAQLEAQQFTWAGLENHGKFT